MLDYAFVQALFAVRKLEQTAVEQTVFNLSNLQLVCEMVHRKLYSIDIITLLLQKAGPPFFKKKKNY